MASNGVTCTSIFPKIGWKAHKLGMEFHITSQRQQPGQKIQACNVTWLPKSADLRTVVCYPGSLALTLAGYTTSCPSANVVGALQPPCTFDTLLPHKHFSSQLNLIQTQRRWRQHIPPNRLNIINIIHSIITTKSIMHTDKHWSSHITANCKFLECNHDNIFRGNTTIMSLWTKQNLKQETQYTYRQ
jgi:hypothetical protein